ncbi:leucine-rich repeat domain-containing protein, partial [Apibacter sp. B2912]|uniref:leucine-rich repeat domain-containing protein n=1 Tax=Apibacter sp. B2912 TaxID=2656763 RepID=UPI0013720DCD
MKNFLLFLFYFLSIFFLQGQVKVIDMEEPGSLSKLLGNEVNTITNLTINGNINPDDIKTLNNMKKLTVLDLSNSSVMDEILPTGAFQSNSVLKNIILPSNITIISKEAFEYAYNINVDASKCFNLKNIGKYAFNGVKGKVVLPDQLETLSYLSFAKFDGIVNLPKNLITIGKEAFEYAYNISVDASKCSNLKNIGEYAFDGVKGKVSLPDQLETLPYRCFANFNGTISLPKNLKTIGQGAFYKASMNTLDLNHCPLLATISKEAFEYAYNISVDASKCSKLKNIGEYAFNGVKGKVVLPDHLESLPYKSFANFNGSVIVIPKNLKTIGKETFYNSNVKTLDLSHCFQLEKLADYAFYGIKEKVILPDHLESLPYRSFANFNGSVIVVPKNLKTIGQEAFYNSNIKTLDLSHCFQLEKLADYAFYGIKEKVILPDHLESLPYRSFANFNGSVIVIPKNLKTIGQEAFYNSNVKSLDLSHCFKLEKLADYAFYGIKEKVILPDHLESLPYRSFANFSGSVIVIPKNLKTIGQEAFYNSNVKSLDLSHCFKLEKLADYAFYGIKEEVILPDHLESLPYRSFANFNGSVIVIPKNLKTIGQEAFYNSNVKTLDLSHCFQLEKLADYAFYGIKEKVILPDHLESLPYRSFANFNGSVIVVPKNLKTIGQEAFYNSNIKILDLSHCFKLEKLADYAFYGIKEKVILPDHLESLPY